MGDLHGKLGFLFHKVSRCSYQSGWFSGRMLGTFCCKIEKAR